MNENLTALAAAPVTSARMSHKGRPAVGFAYLARTLVIVVTLPKTARDAGLHPYLVNEWDTYGAEAVSYFATRPAALAFAAQRAEEAAAPRRENVLNGRGNVATLP